MNTPDDNSYATRVARAAKPWSVPVQAPCRHPSHNPPGHMVIPAAGLRHRCPGCGREILILDAAKASL